MSFCQLSQAAILRRQRHRLLLVNDIHGGQLHPDPGSARFLGLWCSEFRHGAPCGVYHRHVRA
jgi:hypothetical protein